MSTYSLQNAARILKVRSSRLRYWNRTRLAVPRAGEVGGEDPTSYAFGDLVGLKGVLSLLDQGISLRRIRRSVELLRDRAPDIEDPLAALRLWAKGSRRVVVEREGRWMEPDGQVLLAFEGSAPRSRSEVASIEVAAAAGPEGLAGDHFERGCHLDADPETYEEAIEAYREALALDPDFADAHCNLGAVFYNRGERNDARRHFERCLRVDPGHVEAHFNLANVLEEEGCNEMALHHYRTGLVADPFYPDLHINLALLYEKLERSRLAAEHWRRYLQLEPEGSWSEVAKLRLEDDDR
ncbi:MAG: tetratricopeptide repeat protein [Myxococcota bacterium]|nr:tetratricopeptide repeat protein [Myxococcota bacterium]